MSITVDQLFDEPFEPLWLRRQREARTTRVRVRQYSPTTKIHVRHKNKHVYKYRPRPVWNPVAIFPGSPIPYKK